MTTLAAMTDQVLSDLQGYVRTQDSLTVLTGALSDTSVQFVVEDPSALARGTVEIDDELMYVKRVNASTGQIDVIAGGRGWQASTAAAHSSGVIVRNNPLFPRVAVQRALNETIQSMPLYAVKKYDFTFDGTTLIYPMPSECVDVTGISYQSQDSSGRWPAIMGWRPDQNYWPDGATSAKYGVELFEVPPAGRTVRVQYIAQGTSITSAQDYSLSGLPSTSEDVARLGAMYRLVSTIDPGRLLSTSPTADALDSPFPVGKGAEISKYLFQLYSVRLAEEKARQTDQLVAIIHYQ